MSLAADHVCLFSMDLLNVVPLLLDGEWLELRYCPFNAINRAAFEHVHRPHWLSYMRATMELPGHPRTCERVVASEAFLTWSKLALHLSLIVRKYSVGGLALRLAHAK